MTSNRENTRTRNAIIIAAREEFCARGFNENITKAVDMYWNKYPTRVLGEKKRITQSEKRRPRTILDEYERPRCRRCGGPLFFKKGCATCRGRIKKNTWICKECGLKRITKDTLGEAIGKLKRKE